MICYAFHIQIKKIIQQISHKEPDDDDHADRDRFPDPADEMIPDEMPKPKHHENHEPFYPEENDDMIWDPDPADEIQKPKHHKNHEPYYPEEDDDMIWGRGR